MSMPISERRLNIRFINEHLGMVKEAREERQTVTADKPKMNRPPTVNQNQTVSKPTYTSPAKSKK
jgi:hypothetical protein